MYQWNIDVSIDMYKVLWIFLIHDIISSTDFGNFAGVLLLLFVLVHIESKI